MASNPSVSTLPGSDGPPSARSPSPIRVAIVEDDREQARYIREEIAVHPELADAGAFDTGGAAENGLAACWPDVVLVDIGLPDISGIDLVRRCKPALPHTQFMMLTVFEDDTSVFTALAAGATGYLLKKDIGRKLFYAVIELWAGGSPMSGSIARRVVTAFQLPERRQPASPDHLSANSGTAADALTGREREILQLLATGRMYKEIGDQLKIGLGTVNTHIRHIYEKLHAHNRSEAVHLSKFAQGSGLDWRSAKGSA